MDIKRRMILLALFLAFSPTITSAYVIPHPRQREGRRNPRVEIIRNANNEPIRSSRGTLFYRYLPEVKDDRLKKPSRHNIGQLQRARMNKTRIEQSRTFRRERAAQRIQRTSSSATVRGQPVQTRKAPQR